MQEWVRFVQVWCLYEKDWDAGKGEVCAGLMKAWVRFRRKSGWGLCRFDACMRRNQMQEWLRFVQVKCLQEKDSEAGVVEVCACLMLAWEGSRRRSEWGLCRFDASMRRIQTQEWVIFFAGLMLAWEGFKRKSEWIFRRFDACMRRIQTQELVRFVQVWCLYEKDSDARVGEVCAGLMLAC